MGPGFFFFFLIFGVPPPTGESDCGFFSWGGTGDTTDGHRRVSLRGAPSFSRLGQPCRAGGGRAWRGPAAGVYPPPLPALIFLAEKQREGDQQPPLKFIFYFPSFFAAAPPLRLKDHMVCACACVCPCPHSPRRRRRGPRGRRRLEGAAGHGGGGGSGGVPGPSMAGHRRAAAGTTCEAGGDWRAASYDRSRARGSSVQKKMGFGVNLGV